MGEGARRDAGTSLVLSACFALALLVEQREPTAQVDDAYIAYRYATNWLAGHGPVFNPGDLVEGFTSPLWLALVALAVRIGFEPVAAGHALGLASGAAACIAAAYYARALAPRLPGWVAGLSPLLLLTSAPFVRWTTGGLETPLFAAGLTACLAFAARGRLGWLTAALIATTLARPEGALAAAVLLGWGWGSTRGARPAWLAAFVYAGFVVAMTSSRLAYYGTPLPNTFYAKVGGVPLEWGWLYLRGFLTDGAGWLLLPVAFAAWRRPAARPGVAALLLFAAYVVWVGGDLLGEWRFLVPLLPGLAALAAVGAGLAWQRDRRIGGVAALCCVAAAAFFAVGPTSLDGDGEGDGTTRCARAGCTKRARVLDHARRGDRLFEQAGERRAALLASRGVTEALVATGAVGSFGYHSGLEVLDILGLTDATIARTPLDSGDGRGFPGHQRSNADYVLSRRPDYLLIRRRGTPAGLGLRAVAKLLEHPDLEREYVWDEVLRGYARRQDR